MSWRRSSTGGWRGFERQKARPRSTIVTPVYPDDIDFRFPLWDLREVKVQKVMNALNRVPRLKRFLRRSYHLLRGEPQVSYSYIDGEFLQRCIAKPDPTILDIGCNDGAEVNWFLQWFQNPRIFCFEPDPRAVRRFRAKFADRPNVVLFEMALSDRDGDIAFYQSDGEPQDQEATGEMVEGWDLSGSIRKPKEHLSAPCTRNRDDRSDLDGRSRS